MIPDLCLGLYFSLYIMCGINNFIRMTQNELYEGLFLRD